MDEASIASRNVELHRQLFEETGNPMWAWSAVYPVLEHSLPIPDWLSDYLRESAARLMATAGQAEPRYADRVLAALGFRRRRGNDDLSEYAARMQDMVRGIRVWGRVQAEGKSPKAAAEAADDLERGHGDATSHLRGWRFLKELLNL